MIHRFQASRMGHDTRAQYIWLTIYADMITNLMLLFLAFYGLTLMGDKALQEAIASFKAQGRPQVLKSVSPGAALNFDALAAIIKGELEDSPEASVRQDIDRIQISLGSGILFDTGRAEIKADAKAILSRIAGVLKPLPSPILVDGHTDDIPVAPGSLYKDNWELSLARALAVVKYLVHNERMNPRRFSLGAYGPHRSKVPNDSEANRLSNRRVEIAVLKGH